MYARRIRGAGVEIKGSALTRRDVGALYA